MDDVIDRIRKRAEDSFSYWDAIYEEMIADLNFVNGEQWPENIRKEREIDGRPCLTINKLANYGDMIIGDIRQNEPSIKVKPVDSESDPDVAEIFTGLIRNIEMQSEAPIAYDTAAEACVWCGKGTFRVITEYSDGNTFDQDIRIKRVKNPFTVYWDPKAQEWDMADAEYCFITERMDRDAFIEAYPDAMIRDAEGGFDKNPQWYNDKSIRVAEYFEKEVTKGKIYLLSDPITGETAVSSKKVEGFEVLKSRDVEETQIKWYKTNGIEILEGPTDWPGKYIPVCEVWGKELQIQGETVYRGIVRNAKDPQRLYNYSRSNSAELTALAPKAPYMVTSRMIANYQSYWETANRKSWPYLPFEPDPLLPGVTPQRVQGPTQSPAFLQEMMLSNQELHDTTGLQPSSLGQESNETSGKAILARQREGDTANYVFYDNLGRAMAYCGRILLDLIPRIYDTARVLRVIGEDGQGKFVEVNQPVHIDTPQGAVDKIFDLTVGKYDVVVTVGPSFATQREEATENMVRFLQTVPSVAPIIADLIAKNMDYPGASEIAKRLQAMLPPQVMGGQPPPDPKIAMNEQKNAIEKDRLEFEMEKFRYELAKLQSETIKNLAEAESKEPGQQLDKYKAELQAMVNMSKGQNETRA